MKLSVKEIVVFGVLAGMMYASKKAMEFLPNIHLLAIFIVSITVVYRKKALYPIYVYVFAEGVFSGFATWWIPYLYIWTVLWGATMLIPKNIPKKVIPVICMMLCGLHGLLFGVLYAPVQMVLFGLGFKEIIAWIIAGIPFDLIHGISNTACGILIFPLIAVLRKTKSIN